MYSNSVEFNICNKCSSIPCKCSKSKSTIKNTKSKNLNPAILSDDILDLHPNNVVEKVHISELDKLDLDIKSKKSSKSLKLKKRKPKKIKKGFIKPKKSKKQNKDNINTI